MNLRDKACIVGAFEHPTRKADDKSVALLHAEVAKGALDDAGLSHRDVDGYFCAGDAPGLGPASIMEYMGLHARYVDSTDTGGSAYILAVAHAAAAIAAGKCTVALITCAGRPRAAKLPPDAELKILFGPTVPEVPFESAYRHSFANTYGMVAKRHMHEYGTTSEQLAWVKVAASHHSQHNPHAMLREIVTVEEVLNSPMIADPLHKLDCCVISDGGGALVVAHPDIARSLKRPLVKVRGTGEAIKHMEGGKVDVTRLH